ncbi:MAG: type II secretion system F family protein [Planctomycetaceae bacterium]
MSYVQRWLFLTHKAEPLRQTSLLMLLAGSLGHGDSLLQGLKACESESDGEWAGKVAQLRTLLEVGHPLSNAVSMVGDLLPNQTITAIRIGEKTGCLPAVLLDEARRISGDIPKDQSTGITLETLLFWGLMLSSVVMSIVTFLMVFIVPKMKEIFIGFGTELPGPMVLLIEVSDLLISKAYVFLMPLGAATIYGLWLFYRRTRHRLIHGFYRLERYFPRLWVPGLLRMMSLSVATNQPVSLSLDAMMQDMPDGPVAEKFSQLRHRVHQGDDPVVAMGETGLLRQREMLFLHSALRSHHLDWALRHLALEMDRRRSLWRTYLPEVLGPIFVLMMGLVVLFVCVAFFTPLVKLINDLA